MHSSDGNGQITMNRRGTRYTASYHLGDGVMAVTLGAVTRVTHVARDGVHVESVARSILKSMLQGDRRRKSED
jgi:hypothetical protein